MQQQILYHNITANSCESFDHELSGMRRNIDGKGELFVIKQEISNTDA
jgi:hypothetical protein